MSVTAPLTLTLPAPPKIDASEEEKFKYNIALLDALSIIMNYTRNDMTNSINPGHKHTTLYAPDGTGLATYADNAAALAGGLVAGDLYQTSTGVVMIVYTP